MTNIELLKSLTQTTYDSVEGYRKAAETAKSPALKRALETRREKRAETLSMLNSGLVELDESPITEASASGTVHQMFLKITDAFENGDEAAAERVEEGEDYIADQFRDALENNDVDQKIKGWIESAYSEIKVGERFGDMIEKQYA